jgi:uncharacterized protein
MRLTRLASLHRLSPEKSLLINALSGAVDLVDQDLRTKLLEMSVGGRPALDEEQRRALAERGYVFGDEGEERAALLEVFQAYERMAADRPLQLIFCPTYACNLACGYCFESAQTRARPQLMTTGQVAEAFTAARELVSSRHQGKTCQVSLFGGEPLLPATLPVVTEIVARAEEAGFAVQVVTNGTFVEHFAPLFTQHEGVVRGAQITLDGTEPVHDARRAAADGRGSFAQVVRGVECCLDLGIEVNLRVNIDGQNLPHLQELADLLERRGWTQRKGFRCQLAPVTDHTGGSTWPHLLREDQLVEPVLALWRDRPELRKQLDFQLFRVLNHLIAAIEEGGDSVTFPRFHYCETDRGELYAFCPDGLFYACPESIGDRRNAVGRYSPRYELWSKRLQRWHSRSVLTLPECQRCNIATFCGGGCAYAALRQRGTPAHGICGDSPEIVKAYVRVLQRRLQEGALAIPS